jgi:hypothetical protein
MKESAAEFDRRLKESVLERQEAARERQEQSAEFDRRLKESQENFNKRFEKLGNRIGELVESMVEGGVIRIFQELGYEFTRVGPRVQFGRTGLNISGEIDLFLENGDLACLIEVKTNLSVDDVKDHLEKLQKYRRYADAGNDNRRFIAAVGGGVVRENVRIFAQRQGMYVIQQTGDFVEVIPPEGNPRKW